MPGVPAPVSIKSNILDAFFVIFRNRTASARPFAVRFSKTGEMGRSGAPECPGSSHSGPAYLANPKEKSLGGLPGHPENPNFAAARGILGFPLEREPKLFFWGGGAQIFPDNVIWKR